MSVAIGPITDRYRPAACSPSSHERRARESVTSCRSFCSLRTMYPRRSWTVIGYGSGSEG